MKLNLKQVKHLIWALAIACFMMIALLGIAKSLVFLWPVLAFAAAGVAVSLALWRCPHCGGHLGRDVPKYCPHCGEYLDGLH